MRPIHGARTPASAAIASAERRIEQGTDSSAGRFREPFNRCNELKGSWKV